MEIEYTHQLPFPRERVWQVLLDPEVLSRALPGIQQFASIGPDRFSAVMKIGVQAMRGSYAGTVEIVDKQFPSSYRLRGEGKGQPGWARGEALIALAEDGAETRVTAHGKAQVGGTVAGVGQRMMEGVAKGMARDFFSAIEAALRAGNGAGA